MEVKAKLRHVRISPKKIRLVIDVIRGLDVEVALEKLEITFKKSSPVIAKLLKSAVANATDRYEVGAKDLIVKSIMADKGVDLKRWKPAAFGRAHPFKKHSSHVEIVLTTKEGVKVVAKEKKVTPIETVDLTKTKDDKKKGSKDIKQADVKKVSKQPKERSISTKALGGKKDKSNVKKG
ncbi:50S ribosomal protein L22 [Candidatus Parcubacteria bacterium]|nr:50S ribosomal protein L22 [Candidatus Parcubacteria bacterium]MBT7228718.1 50S ribosomal protein L22 [Candidatus Parcubacteria bacterium]